jgi:GNAT superfamily N-acetyltransferase
VRVVELGVTEVDRVAQLWVGVHRHHRAVAPELSPYVDDETTWRRRRPVYEAALADGGFAFVARDRGRDVGYALVRLGSPSWSATFETGETVAELESLAVHPGARGRGIGSRLLDAVDGRLDELGLGDRVVGVVAANVRAVDLYRRRGYTPTWLTVARFGHRDPPGPGVPVAVIEPVAPPEVGALEALWLELHHQHQAVAPHLGPFVGDAVSWEVVRALLECAASDEILLRAGSARSPIGFAWTGVERDDPLWADTWAVGRDVAEVHMLTVTASARGRGIGSALRDATDRLLWTRGVRDQVIGAIEPNADALRLYRRRGFRPAWLELTRHAMREAAR